MRLAAPALAELLIAELTDNVVDRDGLTALDRPPHDWLIAHRSPVPTQLMTGVSAVASTAVLSRFSHDVAPTGGITPLRGQLAELEQDWHVVVANTRLSFAVR